MATIIPRGQARPSPLAGIADAVEQFMMQRQQREAQEQAVQQNRQAVDTITNLGIQQGVFPEGTQFGDTPAADVLQVYDRAFKSFELEDKQAHDIELEGIRAGNKATAAAKAREGAVEDREDEQAFKAEESALGRGATAQEGALDRASRESIAADRLAATTTPANQLTPEQDAMAAASGLDVNDDAQRTAAVILESSQKDLRNDALAAYAEATPSLQGFLFQFEDHDKLQMYNQLRVLTETLIVDSGLSGNPMTFNHAFNLAADKLATGNIFPVGMTDGAEMAQWLRSRGWPIDTVNRYMGKIQEAQAVRQAAEVAGAGEAARTADTSATAVTQSSAGGEPPEQSVNTEEFPTRAQHDIANKNLLEIRKRADPLEAIRRAAGL